MDNEKEELPSIGETLIHHSWYPVIKDFLGFFYLETVNEFVNKIKSINEHKIKTILSSVPIEWNISESQQKNIIEFLIYRAILLKEQFFILDSEVR